MHFAILSRFAKELPLTIVSAYPAATLAGLGYDNWFQRESLTTDGAARFGAVGVVSGAPGGARLQVGLSTGARGVAGAEEAAA